jgi:hypothetical protein
VKKEFYGVIGYKHLTGTRVDIEITCFSETDLDKIIEMGFREGFTAALINLDELL